MENQKEYNKPFRCMIVNSQDRDITELKNKSRNIFNLKIANTHIIKMAISELLEKVNNEHDLKMLLEKYNYI